MYGNVDARALRPEKRELQAEIEAFATLTFSHGQSGSGETIQTTYNSLITRLIKLKEDASRVSLDDKL